LNVLIIWIKALLINQIGFTSIHIKQGPCFRYLKMILGVAWALSMAQSSMHAD